MKTYEEYEKEYEKILLSAKPNERVVKKEIWIGFKLTEDENKVPSQTKEFMDWIENLDNRLVQCVQATMELVLKLNG